jgi:hypothetical protein
MSHWRLAAVPILLSCACNVTSTVGYNDAARCAPDAPLHGCANGTCVVSDLFEAEKGIETMAVDAEDIFFVSAPEVIAKRPIGGGPLTELTATGTLVRLTVDAYNVYWTEFDGSVKSVPKAGGPALDVSTLFGHPSSIATDPDHVYWVLPDSGEVAMAPTPSGPATRLTGQPGPQAVAVDVDHVYWINEGDPGAMNGQLARAPLGNLTAAEVIRSDLDAPLFLAIAGDDALWATSSAIFRMPKAGGEPVQVASGFDMPRAIAGFDGIVYLSGQSGLTRTTVASGETRVLDIRPMTSLALGCTGVYATTWYESELVRYGK